MDSSQQLTEAVAFIRSRCSVTPEVALVLGSGLGAVADAVENPTIIDTADIPHMPSASVSGHKGRFVLGTFGARSVVMIQGRLHLYEGHDIATVVFPIRIVRALGASSLFVTNASGGINADFSPGTLMWITDHVNQTGVNPLIRKIPRTEGGAASQVRHFVDFYDVEWTARAEKAGRKLGIETKRGVYIWTRGPSYETKAEIRAFRTMGADAVGMSTVPEVIQARKDGMRVIGLSTITNPAAGLGEEPLNHDEVIETGNRVQSALEKLAFAAVQVAPHD